MNTVYFAVGAEFAKQAELAASAMRLSNPHARAWVITDQETQFETLEPYRTHTSEATLMYDRTLAQWQFLREHARALFLDSDCVVNCDLKGVFAGDVCVTVRKPPLQVPEQIYNGGVLYAEGGRAIRFWQDWADQFPVLPRDKWAWWGDQMTLPGVVEHHVHSVTVYPSETHNYVPTQFHECLEPMGGRVIVHFKGKRKDWMPIYVDVLRAHHGAETVHRSAECAV